MCKTSLLYKNNQIEITTSKNLVKKDIYYWKYSSAGSFEVTLVTASEQFDVEFESSVEQVTVIFLLQSIYLRI